MSYLEKKQKKIQKLFILTARVFKAVDGVRKKADTAQEPSPLLFMNLLVIPHADSDWIGFPDVSEVKGIQTDVCLQIMNNIETDYT